MARMRDTFCSHSAQGHHVLILILIPLRLQKRCCKTENGRVGNDSEWRFNWCLPGLLIALSVRDPLWQQNTDRRKETSSSFILSIKRTAGGQGWTPGEPWGEMRYGRKKRRGNLTPAEGNFSNLWRPYLEDSWMSVFSNVHVKTPKRAAHKVLITCGPPAESGAPLKVKENKL